MSNPFSNLSDDNHEQIRKYLKFFRLKKDGMLRSLQREIDEIKADRLNEDMYTKDDVSEFADFLSSAIKVFSRNCGIVVNLFVVNLVWLYGWMTESSEWRDCHTG
jgi:hypothetical protein